MKTAYLIDHESIGGGCEYIQRKSAERQMMKGDCRTFYSEKGECRAKVLDEWGADEIVVNHLRALLQLLGWPWERPKGRIRFVVHGIHPRKYDWMMREFGLQGLGALPGWLCAWGKRCLRRSLEAWLYRRCDEIVALTDGDRADILRLYGRKLNVVVEPNTLDGWKPQLAENLPPGITGSFKYVFIGRFDYQKGQDRWIKEEVKGKKKKGQAGRTLFIGDGETLENCKVLAEELGVADQCVFAGAIPDADRYLKCAEVVVSASRWEGMPYLLMKARALGCRILATDCPGNREVLAGYDKWELLQL